MLKNKKWLLSFFVLAGAVSLASCGGGSSSSTSSAGGTSSSGSNSTETSSSSVATVTQYTVTFDENYTGGSTSQVLVDENTTVSKPSDPTREDYTFIGWYIDTDLSESYDFDTLVTSSFTLYAGWVDTANSLTVTFYYNYEGASDPIYLTSYFENGGRVSKPADPEREGYTFGGWYEDSACTSEFSFMKRRSENAVAYAYWQQQYTFEAEYTQLTGLDDDTCDANGNKLGQGYSGNVVGKGLIAKDSDSVGANASNGAYITNLYYNGAYLEYKIVSDSAVSDAILQLRLSAEFYDISISDDDFLVEVNGTQITYDDISFTGVITDMTSDKKRPFTTYYINTVDLVEGENTIQLIVNNTDSPQTGAGSMDSKAPMIDCLYLTTDATLTWDPYTSNLS